MQSSSRTSPLLSHATRVRAKNVELRKKIAQLESDIQMIEKDIASLTSTHDDLVGQCQTLREKQTDQTKALQLEEYQSQFNAYIHGIETYLNTKQWNVPLEAKPMAPFEFGSSAERIAGRREHHDRTSMLAPKPTPTIAPVQQHDPLPAPTLTDVLNQQLSSVENWLMESAVTDINKQSPILTESQRVDDGADDLYKDLIFPSMSDDPPAPTEEIHFDENEHRDDFVKAISPKQTHEQQSRLDKNQRRFALMRQLAEKSNKTATRKLL